ncbi:MAG: hypothetical protein ACO3C1_10320 [Ilumatobacteraceae bacterium]
MSRTSRIVASAGIAACSLLASWAGVADGATKVTSPNTSFRVYGYSSPDSGEQVTVSRNLTGPSSQYLVDTCTKASDNSNFCDGALADYSRAYVGAPWYVI